MATDAHNVAYRPPVLSEAFKKISEISSAEVATALFIDNPKTISKCKFIEAA